MTEHEQKLFAQFSAQARKQLKQMSKNQLVQTCVALLIDNYGLKGALEQYMKAKQELDAVAAEAPKVVLDNGYVTDEVSGAPAIVTSAGSMVTYPAENITTETPKKKRTRKKKTDEVPAT